MAKKKNIVVFTGAGVSAESGIKTFRDADGLWENYNVMDVATPEAWEKDKALVLEFYNQRRKQVLNAQPNLAHKLIADLEQDFEVQVITQNIDDLHERAGSTKVLHLHGEITKSRSTAPPYDLFDIKGDKIKLGDICPRGFQLRPHVVWFGEAVPLLPDAEKLVSIADIFIVIGTSLNVYPAAGLVYHTPETSMKYLIDPKAVSIRDIKRIKFIKETAGHGMTILMDELKSLA